MTFTKEEDNILLKNHKKSTTKELKELLEKAGFDRSESSVRNRCKRLNIQPVRYVTAATTATPHKAQKATQKLPKLGTTIPRIRRSKIAKKILSLSDLHIPFHRIDYIREALNKHSDATDVVLNGDILDCYSVSSFAKYRQIPLIDEYVKGVKLVDEIRQEFPNVHLIAGNHENRLTKWFSKNVSLEISTLMSDDILARVANGEVYRTDGTVKELLPFTNVHYNVKTKWYKKIGKTMFAHPSSYSTGPGATALKTHQKMYSYSDYDALVIGHTHQMGKYIYMGKLMIEQGALCNKLEYQINPSLRYGPFVNGYAVVYQDSQGNTDINRSTVEFLGTELGK